jgi:hypothetical protein
MRIKVGIGGLRLVQRSLSCGRESLSYPVLFHLSIPFLFVLSCLPLLTPSLTQRDKELINRYQASLPDELDLRPGMKLKVLRLYDDAWGTAQVVSGGMEGERTEGSFPIVRLPFRILGYKADDQVCVSEGSSFGTPSAGSSEGSAH